MIWAFLLISFHFHWDGLFFGAVVRGGITKEYKLSFVPMNGPKNERVAATS